MKIFPTNNFLLELNNESTEAIRNLQKETLSDEQFIVNWNDKTFIGTINQNEFKLRLSKKLYGGFCILKGKLENESGILETQVSKLFKVIFGGIVLFCLSGILISIIQNKLEILIPLVMTILIFRFVFIELGYRLVSKRGINKLAQILGIATLRKTRHNN